MAEGTRSICLAPGVLPAGAHNEATVVADIRGLRMRSGETGRYFIGDVPEASFEDLYRRHYDEIAAAYSRHAGEPGVLVAALVPGFGLRGRMWLAAAGAMRSGIAGRHEHVDLHLPDDPALSLRHLAVLVRSEKDAVRIRVFDLRTGTLFRDEADRELAAVAADGPLFLRASLHRFFLLPTGPAQLPPWESLPPRHFADARTSAPLPAARPIAPGAMPVPFAPLSEPTVVTASAPLAAPEWLDLVADGESAIGHLRVHARGRTTVLAIGAARAARGILLGRYQRCDGVVPAGWLPDEVSRVHALLLYEGGTLHVVDAGSTNGTRVRGHRVHCEPMPPGERVDIAGAALIWDPAN